MSTEDSSQSSWTNQSPNRPHLPSKPIDGCEWEEYLVGKIKEYIWAHHQDTLQNLWMGVPYDEYPAVQEAGLDMIFGGADLKTRTNFYWDSENPDLYIEVDKADGKGWARNELSKFVPYCWETGDRKNIQQSVLIIKRDGWQSYVDYVEDDDKYETKPSGDSAGVIVPLSDVPQQFLDRQIDLTIDQDLPHPIDEMGMIRNMLNHYEQLVSSD